MACVVVDSDHLVENKDYSEALMNTKMNLSVPWKMWNPLTIWATITSLFMALELFSLDKDCCIYRVWNILWTALASE
jgi:hypothetical protein